MRSVSEISHEATVKSVEDGTVTLLLSPGISCSGCMAEKSCGVSGTGTKTIITRSTCDLSPGQKVEVSIETSQGFTALFLGYLLPLLIVIITLVTLLSIKASELVAGVTSFAILIPYYIILWLLRDHIGKKFSFKINLPHK